MMIDPKTYVELVLKKDSKEEILEEIRDYKAEISRLKRMVKRGETDEMVCPSPEVRLDMYGEYLKAAQEYYDSLD